MGVNVGLMGYVLWFSKSFPLCRAPFVDFYVKRKLICHREEIMKIPHVKWKVSFCLAFVAVWPCCIIEFRCAVCALWSISSGSLGEPNWSIGQGKVPEEKRGKTLWKCLEHKSRPQLCVYLFLYVPLHLSLSFPSSLCLSVVVIVVVRTQLTLEMFNRP